MRRLAVLCLLLLSCEPPNAPAGKTVVVPGDGILVMGDFGTGTMDQYSTAAGMRAFCQVYGCDFGLTVGDNFYPDGVSGPADSKWQTHFERPYQYLKFKFYPTLGNHDYRIKESPITQIMYKSPRWEMPGRYYSIINEDAEFFGIDTQKWDNEQALWLDQKLEQSAATWKVVFGHHPMFSHGLHGDTWTLHGSLGKILKEHRVDLYLSGHDHHLEMQERRDGVGAYVVSGAAAKTRGLRPWPKSSFIKEGLGFAHITFVDKPCLTLRFANKNGSVLHTKRWCKP